MQAPTALGMKREFGGDRDGESNVKVKRIDRLIILIMHDLITDYGGLVKHFGFN